MPRASSRRSSDDPDSRSTDMSASPAGVVREVLDEIALSPREQAAVLWRPRVPLTRPEAQDFDREQCCELLAQVPVYGLSRSLLWHRIELPSAMTPAEARFWFEAILSHCSGPKAQSLADELRTRKLEPNLPLHTVRSRLHQRRLSGVDPALVIPIWQALGLAGLWHMIRNDCRDTNWDVRIHLCVGLAQYVVPYLDDSQVESLRDEIRQVWDPTRILNAPDEPFELDHYLAAALGMHAEVYDLLSRIPDVPYRYDRLQPPGIHLLLRGLGSAEEIIAEQSRLEVRLQSPEDLRWFLACTCLAGLEVAVQAVRQADRRELTQVMFEELALIRSPRVAPAMLDLKLNSPVPQLARDWLKQYVGCAVHGLLETAGGRGKLADAALQFLRETQLRGERELVAGAIDGLADSLLRSKLLRDVVQHQHEACVLPAWESDELTWFAEAADRLPGTSRNRFPGWIDWVVLPPVIVEGRRLNEQQTMTLVRVLSQAKLQEPPELVRLLKQNAVQDSLDEFAWKLFELWQAEGAPSGGRWALSAIGLLGGDRSALKLAPLIRVWPGERQHTRAVQGLQCLRAIGSDTALMQLNGIAGKLRFQGIKQKAREFMTAIAEQRGLTSDELADRIVPDLNLNGRGTREFDYGSRRFQFLLGPEWKPILRDDQGKLLKDLPKPGKTDDPERSAQSRADWKLFKKQLTEAVKIQVPRLEQAMVCCRRWTTAAFETLIVHHPLMMHLARGLVWGCYDSNGLLGDTFRITQERDYAGIEDDVYILKPNAVVGLVHPVDLHDSMRERWGELFSDYKLTPCFPQLGRGVYRLTSEEADQKAIMRFEGLELHGLTMIGLLERMGWIRGEHFDGGWVTEHEKPFPGLNITAHLTYEEGFSVVYQDTWKNQRIDACTFLRRSPGTRSGETPDDIRRSLMLGEVPPVVLSEVLRDLYLLESKGRRKSGP